MLAASTSHSAFFSLEPRTLFTLSFSLCCNLELFKGLDRRSPADKDDTAIMVAGSCDVSAVFMLKLDSKIASCCFSVGLRLEDLTVGLL